jgi:nucleotide-binding universal stress UspA family protein
MVREIAVPVLAVRPRERAPAATPPPGTEPGTGQIPGTAIAAAEHTAHGSALLEGTLALRPLLPLDGSELAESALEPLLDLVGPDAHYTLLRVIQIPVTPDMMTGSWASEVWYEQVPVHERQVQEYLDSVASRLAGRVREVETVVLTELNPAIAILNYAAEHQIDLIAISTRGHGGLKRLALGSVTDKVLRGADVPVLVVRPE